MKTHSKVTEKTDRRELSGTVCVAMWHSPSPKDPEHTSWEMSLIATDVNVKILKITPPYRPDLEGFIKFYSREEDLKRLFDGKGTM